LPLIQNDQTENELNDRLSESSLTTTPAAPEDASAKNDDEVNVNYTISSPLRKTLRTSFDKDEDDSEQKISATFTISPPPRTNSNSISQLASRLEKGLDLEPETANSVTATINVPLITSKTTTAATPSNNATDISDKLKKTDHASPPIPQPRSLFDIDNATSMRLADKLQQEAKKCDVNAIGDGAIIEPLSHLTEPLPPSPIHHTIFGERRPSWRLKSDFNNKVNRGSVFKLFQWHSLWYCTQKILFWHLGCCCCSCCFDYYSYYYYYYWTKITPSLPQSTYSNT
jgi:hypothetical protein